MAAGDGESEAEREGEEWERRTLAVFPDEEGMYVVRGVLPAEVGAVLMRALEAASEALWRGEGSPGGLEEEESRAAANRRRADAVGLLAERALEAGFGGRGEGESGAGPDPDPGLDPDPVPVPISGTRAGRYQVLVHVELERLEGEGRGGCSCAGSKTGEAGRGPRSELQDGTRVSAETSRRLACDASLAPVVRGRDGQVEWAGASRRTVSGALRRALEARDLGCRFPGCGTRFAEVHHVVHWAGGGETSLGNCLLLCRFHHRLVHEGGWTVRWWGKGQPGFRDPRGQEHLEGGWELPAEVGPDPAAELVREQLREGITPGAWTAAAG